MIVDKFEEVLQTAALPAAASVAPIPSVIPGSEPIYQVAGDAGQKVLWVVFAIMLIASGAFTLMSWNVPLVRCNPSD
jgi:hypothetical protein